MAADGAGLARVPRGNPDQMPSVSGQLVVQDGQKDPPSLREDRAVQAGLLPDLLPGGLDRSPGGAGHVPDSQVLDRDDRLGFADRRRGLVKKIQTHVRDSFVSSRHPSLLFCEVPAFRSLPVFPGEFPLLPGKALFRPFHRPQKRRIRMQSGSVREGGKDRHPEVESNGRSGFWQKLGNLPLRLDGDRPSPGPLPDGDVLDLSLDLPGEAKLDPSHLGEKDPGKDRSTLRVGRAQVELRSLGIEKGGLLALLLEPGEPFGVLFIQGFPDRPVEVFEGLVLGRGGGPGPESRTRRSPARESEVRRVPVGQERHLALEPPLLEVESLVPDEPRASGVAGEKALLFGRGTDPECEDAQSLLGRDATRSMLR